MKKNELNVVDLDFKEKIENNEFYQKQIDFEESIKTNFLISAIFMLIESVIPILILWLLTGNDLWFSYNIKISLAWILFFSELFLSIILTCITYLLKLHKTDQFTYLLTLQLTLLTMYITGFYLNKYIILYRVLISFVGLIIGVLIGTFISSIIYNFKLKKLDNKKK